MKKLSCISLSLIFIILLALTLMTWREMRTNTIPPDTMNDQVQSSVIIDVPLSNSVVKSPLTVSGTARGTWYFEASFPIEIVDAHGTVLGSGVAQAQGDWMTVDYVPFTATITFTPATTDTGLLILRKDNPSGLPEHDAIIAIPITF